MKICVGIAGSIAAYRSADFVKELVAAGHEVEVVPTRSALEFVSARVLETFAGRRVHHPDIFHPSHEGTDHISTARWAEAFVVYGATAETLAKLAAGRGDDFMSLQILAFRGPVFVVPAMNPSMWEHPAVRANAERLRTYGYQFVGPSWGKVACGESGYGHIAPHSEIFASFASLSRAPQQNHPNPGANAESSLRGRRILLSAGPMRTSLDAVRYVQNRSSGRMGLELARALREAGALVSVILGPVGEEIARGFADFPVTPYVTLADYDAAVAQAFRDCDVFVSAAAVLDFEVQGTDAKISREALAANGKIELAAKASIDFVARAVAERRPGQKVVAFALEAGDDAEVVAKAQAKLARKGADAIVANPARAGAGPGGERNRLWFLSKSGETKDLGEATKETLARRLASAIASMLA